MMCKYNIPTLGVLILFVAPLTGHTTVCHSDGMQREVHVVYEEPGQPLPCKVQYRKQTEQPNSPTLTLWRAEHEVGYCENRAAGFVAKLQSLGWTCAITADAETADDTPAPEVQPEADLDLDPDLTPDPAVTPSAE